MQKPTALRISYPENLPISKEVETIAAAIKENQVVVIAGETGSGKTTQIPKICLEALSDRQGRIGCTQPRRLAATSVAERVAEEIAPQGRTREKVVEKLVGYKIRFHDRTSHATKIKFMTDGVLLAETRKDPLLKQYHTLIIDEAHERSLNIDFLLGYLKQLIPKRPDLKIIITSATIDTKAFAKHFSSEDKKVPIIEVSGRSYPVDVRYRPLQTDEGEEAGGSIEQVIATVDEIFKNRSSFNMGDILVFLATERDIRECCSVLENRHSNTVVLPLFGRLAAGDQARIFKKNSAIKIIVSTNVAETSITVPGIRYVIDSGFARISQYNIRAKTTSLPISKISQASANQRKGRAGRVAPGICYRLYSEEDFESRSEFGVPEIKRSNLAEVILQMTSLHLGDPLEFSFIDPPHPTAIREGYTLLRELGAIKGKNCLTKNGAIMAQLPVDPCISRVLLEAQKYNSLKEVTIISSILAIQDPRIRPAESESKADEAHKQFLHPYSDFMTLLNIWRACFASEGMSWSKLKKFCKKNYLSFQRMREWRDLHEQLIRILGNHQELFNFNENESSYEQIHRPFLSGFLRNIARRKQDISTNSANPVIKKVANNTFRKKIKIYQGGHNKELMIFPGSSLFAGGPEWILAASFVETSRLYALTVATIEPEWIEQAAGGLCKYSWAEPRWQKKKGFVQAQEAASLFGLPLLLGRNVNFAKRDNKNIPEARKIFISRALVGGELSGNYPFLRSNLSLIAKWQESESKLRTRNLVADEDAFFTFYDKKLPENICDQRELNRFLKQGINTLFMCKEDILLRNFTDNELVNFPQHRNIGGIDVALTYHFEPGNADDGVTFRLPLDFAINVSAHHFEWLVPGLLKEKVVFLLKSLVKSIRKRLVPVQNSADAILDDIEFGDGNLFAAMEKSILKQFRINISRSDWNLELPVHLQPRFLIFDDCDRELAKGRNLVELVQKTRSLALAAGLEEEDKGKGGQKSRKSNVVPNKEVQHYAKLVQKWKNSEHRDWNFEGLPQEIPSYSAGGAVLGFLYTVLQSNSQKGCVVISFEKEKEKALSINYYGILYLFALQFREQYKSLKRLVATELSGPSTMFLSVIGGKAERNQAIVFQIIHSIYGCTTLELATRLPDKESFVARVKECKQEGFFKQGQHYFSSLLSALRKRKECTDQMQALFRRAQSKGHNLPQLQGEFSKELVNIFPVELLSSRRFIDYSLVRRELDAFTIRLERFYVNPIKDAQKAQQLLPFVQRLEKFNAEFDQSLWSDDTLNELEKYKTMLAEFKISIFAPEMKKRFSISPKKLDAQWKKIA